MKEIYKNKINWGLQMYLFSFFIILLDLSYLAYMISAINNPGALILLIFLLPFAMLTLSSFPILMPVVCKFAKKEYYKLIIYDTSIEIGKTHLKWQDVKSISFSTGRLIKDHTFCYGFKLPAFQRIYVLDSLGNEVSAIIDVDYFLKKGRKENNLVKIKEILIESGKINILSDWAQK